jgi:hypothetical protein
MSEDSIELMRATIPYLRALLNLHDQRVAPCMSSKDAKELEKIIDRFWQIVVEYDKEKKGGF